MVIHLVIYLFFCHFVNLCIPLLNCTSLLGAFGQAMQENMMNESEAAADDLMVELEEFWGGDMLLPNA